MFLGVKPREMWSRVAILTALRSFGPSSNPFNRHFRSDWRKDQNSKTYSLKVGNDKKSKL